MTKLEKIKSDQASGGFVALLFAVMFIALSVIFSFCPLVSDDREFLSLNYKSFAEAINYALHYGNGRFLGNLGAILLAPHPMVATLYKAMTISLLGILLPRLCEAKNKVTYLLSYFLLLTVSSKMYAQVYFWNCGNVNYATPIALFVLGLMTMKSQVKSAFDFVRKCILIFVFGIAQQLFIEHNAVVNVCVAVGIMLYTLYKRSNKKRLLSFLWTLSNVIGFYLLFFIPKLVGGNMIRDMSDYRKFSIYSIGDIIYTVTENGVLISTYFASFAFLSVAMMILSYCKLKEFRGQKKVHNVLVKTLNISNFICSLLSVFFTAIGSSVNLFYKSRRFLWILCIVAFFECLVYFISTIFFSSEKSSKIVGTFSLIVFVVSLAPLLIVSPIGWRNAYMAFCVIVFDVLFEFDKLMHNKFKKVSEFLIGFFSVAISVILLYLGIVTADIDDYSKQLSSYIEREMKSGKTEIQVFMIPSDYFSKNLMLEYEYYYDKPGDIKFESVEYEVWQYCRNKEQASQPQQ